MKIIVLFLALCAMEFGTPESSYQFIYDSQGALTISDLEHATFQSAKENNRGAQNGIYWFRIDSEIADRSILEIKNAHVSSSTLYDASGKIIPKMSKTRFPSFFLVNKTLEYPLYLKADFPLEAYFPIHHSTEEEYAQADKLGILGIGFFYGSTLALIIATLFFFIVLKNSEFLFFSLLVVAISLSITGQDNILYLFGLSSKMVMILESLGHLLIGLSALGYVHYYIILRENQQWIKRGMFFISTLSIFSWFVFLQTEFIYAFALVDITTIVTILLLWLVLSQIAKGNKRVFLLILYPVNTFLLVNIFILKLFDLSIFEATPTLASFVAIGNFSLIAINLLYSLRNMQKVSIERELEIDNYILQIKELDTYKTIEDAEDSYMESLIYTFKLENIEIKVLTEISNGKSNAFIEEKYRLSGARLAAITNSIYSKLGINDRQVLSNFSKLAV